MNKVIRVISALGAGASLVWGIARSLRRKRGSSDDGGPDWPPKDAEQAASAAPAKPAPAEQAAEEPEQTEPVAEASPKETEPTAAPEEPVVDSAQDEDSEEPPVVKGVAFENPTGVVELVNTVDEEALKELGIKGKASQRVLETRPIETVHDLAVPGIGRRTLQALAGATE